MPFIQTQAAKEFIALRQQPAPGLAKYVPMGQPPEFVPLLTSLAGNGLANGCHCQDNHGMGQIDMSWLTNPVAGVPVWAWIVGAFAIGYFAPALLQQAQAEATPPPPPPPRRKKGWFGL